MATAWVDLSGDGGVLKRVERPPLTTATWCLGAKRVKLAYEGRVEDGDVFDSSSGYGVWLEPDKLVKGFSMGLLTCAVGERAELRLTPAYAYGSKADDPLATETLLFSIEVFEVEVKPSATSGKSAEAVTSTRQAADEARAKREEEQAAVQARKAAAAERAAALTAKKGGGGKPGKGKK